MPHLHTFGRGACENNRLKKLIGQKNRAEALRGRNKTLHGNWKAPEKPVERKRADLSNVEGVLQKLQETRSHQKQKVDAFFACTSMLRECVECNAVDQGQRIYAEMQRHKMVCRTVSQLAIQLYIRSGMLTKAAEAFSEIKEKTQLCYNLMVSGYAQNGHYERALWVFYEMRMKPDDSTLIAALNVCANGKLIQDGIRIHGKRIGSKQMNPEVHNAVLNMYVSWGYFKRARRHFEREMKRQTKNARSWDIIICASVQCGCTILAIKLFRTMLHEPGEFVPSMNTVVSVLSACKDISEARKMHAFIISCERVDMEHPAVRAALIEMYAKCGGLADAQQVFDVASRYRRRMNNTTSVWNALIKGYAQAGLRREALVLFRKLRQPDGVTFAIMLSACKSIWDGKHLHEWIIRRKVQIDDPLKHALLGMYSRCGIDRYARKLFEKVQEMGAQRGRFMEKPALAL